MSDFLVSHEATITLVAGAATVGVPVPAVPKAIEVPEVGISTRGRRLVRATPVGQDPVRYMLGEKDGSGYLDVYIDMTTDVPFPDGIEAVLTVTHNVQGGDTPNTITGTVMLHKMRQAPVGLSSPPGKQRLRYDWAGTLEKPLP